MKCETPALASVSSREPAPIQKPSATERTLGTRSEMTRSPVSSSESSYFCIRALSRCGATAADLLLRVRALDLSEHLFVAGHVLVQGLENVEDQRDGDLDSRRDLARDDHRRVLVLGIALLSWKCRPEV